MDRSYPLANTGRMVNKVLQRGRCKRRGEAYTEPYVEPLSDARTMLAALFNILLEKLLDLPFSP